MAATVYVVEFMEPGAVATRPVPIKKAEFQRAFLRLSLDVRLARRTPKEAAHELLSISRQQPQDIETVASTGDWNLESYRGEGFTLVPEQQDGPVRLTPVADEALREKYLQWCVHQGGGDCLGLLDDGSFLRTDDRRTLALALALGTVLDETRAALGRELLDVQALVSLVVWTVALYCMMWVVPEPTTKAVAASPTLILMGYLGLSEYWLARLLEREARGRYVENEVSRQFKHLYNFSRNKGVDVEAPGGFKYEILSGTESNLARHGRRMAGEFFRMLTF
ncbi:hypothetical protein [Melittangium boletus]|uniref:hypothetical protein n=1 Tax=Melittangium boletus TaxID=83453 RepID=UPI003182EF2E